MSTKKKDVNVTENINSEEEPSVILNKSVIRYNENYCIEKTEDSKNPEINDLEKATGNKKNITPSYLSTCCGKFKKYISILKSKFYCFSFGNKKNSIELKEFEDTEISEVVVT